MGKLTSMHFYKTSKGFKDWYLLLRTQAAAAAIQFTVDQNSVNNASKTIASLEKLNQRKYIAKSVSSTNDWGCSTEPTSLENSVADLKISDRARIPLRTTTPLNQLNLLKSIQSTESTEPAEGQDAGDIYSSKVIACAIDNPESCTMCSG